jgi:hypothetical protein
MAFSSDHPRASISKTKYFRWHDLLLLLCYATPVILGFWFVSHYGVNSPYMDDIARLGLLGQAQQGSLKLQYLVAHHNEHIIFFPKILSILVLWLSGANLKAEMFLSVCLIGLTFYAISRISKNHFALLVSGFILFAFSQNETLLWAFQTVWFLANLFALAILNLSNRESSPNRNLILAGLCCAAATFSAGHGIISWIAMIPSILALEGKMKQHILRLGAWLSALAVSLGLYLINLKSTNFSSPLATILQKPLLLIQAFLAVLSNPFSSLASSPEWLGGIALLFFLGFNVYFVRVWVRADSKVAAIAPWLSFGWFAILYAVMLTRARIDFGIPILAGPRYSTGAIFLAVACIQLLNVYRHKFMLYLIGAVMLTGLFQANLNALEQGEALRINRSSGQSCTKIASYLEPTFDDIRFAKLLYSSPRNYLKDRNAYFERTCLDPLFPVTLGLDSPRSMINVLDQLKLRKPAQQVTFAPVDPRYGAITSPPSQDSIAATNLETIQVAGWAAFPDSIRQPTYVLFSVGDRTSFFASAFIKLDSPDVAKQLQSDRFNRARWEVKLPLISLPPGKNTIKAWVFDEDRNRFVLLLHQLSVSR